MGYKKLTNEQEKILVEEYKAGATVSSLMKKYGYKTKKSITDKVKKYYPEEKDSIIKEAKNNRKNYNIDLSEINSEFNAYLIGLLLTDGYVNSNRAQIGIDLIDEDCIKFLSSTMNINYNFYSNNTKGRFRLLIEGEQYKKQVERYGLTSNKTYNLQAPKLYEREEKFIPYIIRGIIDGDGTMTPTSYGAPQFRIVTQSKDFKNWLILMLENKMFMKDISCSQNKNGLWSLGSAEKNNIEKLIVLSYNKPFGMNRKYEELRRTFRDYNKCI